MADTDGSVAIDINLDTSEVEKDLARIRAKIIKLADELSEKNYTKSALEKQLQNAEKNLISIQNKYKGTLHTDPEEEQAILAAEREVARLKAELDKCNQSIMAGNIALDAAKNRYGEISSQVTSASDELDESSDSIEDIGDGAEEAAEGVEDMADATDRANGFMSKFSKRIIGLAKRVFVFSLITSALRSIRSWLSEVIKKNDEANAAFAKLKGALLTLAQPLVEVIIPALTTLANILTVIITEIASFISGLFGKTVEQSAEAAKGLYGEAEAIESVGGAAKDAAQNLAGFDEINTLQSGSKSGGGGSSSTATMPDFTLSSAIPAKLKEIANLVMLIGAGFLSWKIGTALGSNLKETFGLIMAIYFAIKFIINAFDAWVNGIDWDNLIGMITGAIGVAIGLGIAFGPLVAGISLVVTGLTMLAIAFNDAMKSGWNLQNLLTAISGILATGLGIALIVGGWIPLLIAAIAALLLSFTVATGHGEELLSGIKEMIQGFSEFFSGIFSGDIKRAISGIEKIFSGLKTTVFAIFDGLQGSFDSFINWIDQKTNGKLKPILDFIRNLFTGVLQGFRETAGKVVDGLKQIFTGVVQFISGVFTGDWDKAWEGVKNIFKGIMNNMISVLEGAINLFIRGINWLISQVNKIKFTAPDWVPLVGGKSFGINIPAINSVSIPRLAQGAVIPPNREFMAVLGDQKSGTNVEAPLDTIKQALVEALRESGGSGGDIHITVELDGDVVARKTVKHINNMTIQTGKSVLLY